MYGVCQECIGPSQPARRRRPRGQALERRAAEAEAEARRLGDALGAAEAARDGLA